MMMDYGRPPMRKPYPKFDVEGENPPSTGRIRESAEEALRNADWTKKSWDLPPYKSPEFMRYLAMVGKTLDEFRTQFVYQSAVKNGLIVDDEWVGD